MVDYLRKHEEFVSGALKNNGSFDWDWLRDYHRTQIEYLQHERLIHLMVTLSFGFFLIITVLFAVAFEKAVILLVSLLTLVLLIPYIVHYYKLENGVQRWYKLYNRIDENCRKRV